MRRSSPFWRERRMNAVEFAELLPKRGTIAVSGGRYEDEIISAVAYVNSEGGDLKLIPLSPMQIQRALELGIPTVRGYPTYFILQAEYKGPDYLLQSQTASVFADRIMSKMAEHVWAFVTRNVKKTLVEAVPQFLDYTLDELSLYGEVEEHFKNYMGHVLIRLKPFEEDFFHLAHTLRDIPGVIDVGIYLEPPEKILVFK